MDGRKQLAIFMVPMWMIGGWVASAWFMGWLRPDPLYMIRLIAATVKSDELMLGSIFGFLFGIAIVITLFRIINEPQFSGEKYRKFIRGIKMISPDELAKKTKEKGGHQVTIADIPVPKIVEPQNFLFNGGPGSGKSYGVREIKYGVDMRGDRSIIFDDKGELYSRFGMPNDKILNPFDTRTEGWTIFNEVRNFNFDFEKLALSVVPPGTTPDEEVWRGYARILWASVAKKLMALDSVSKSAEAKEATPERIWWWTMIAPKELLHDMLRGTYGEALFSGANDSFASARFILSKHLPAHMAMPQGDFSIRDWLDDPNGGNLYIIRRADVATAMRPLVSCWADTFCSAILARSASHASNVWLFIDEPSTLDKLNSLVDAATNGRKNGLRIVLTTQTISLLEEIYGQKGAEALLACMGTIVALGGSNVDERTNEKMSEAIGNHEIKRIRKTDSGSLKESKTIEVKSERLVLKEEISSTDPLTGYLRFSRNKFAAKVTMKARAFKERNPEFIERPSSMETFIRDYSNPAHTIGALALAEALASAPQPNDQADQPRGNLSFLIGIPAGE